MSTVPHGAHHSHVSPSKFFQVLVKIKAEEFLGSNIINQDSGSLYLISIYLWYKWGRPKEEIELRNHDINQLIFWKIGCSQKSCHAFCETQSQPFIYLFTCCLSSFENGSSVETWNMISCSSWVVNTLSSPVMFPRTSRPPAHNICHNEILKSSEKSDP